jgi:hypothetical protein
VEKFGMRQSLTAVILCSPCLKDKATQDIVPLHCNPKPHRTHFKGHLSEHDGCFFWGGEREAIKKWCLFFPYPTVWILSFLLLGTLTSLFTKPFC